MTSYVVIFVVSLLLMNAYMYFQQPRMIFYPFRELFQTPADRGLNFESEVQARGLILESTFSSARDFARVVFPILARLVWIRYDFNAVESIQRVTAPVLVLHSPDDEIMPFHLGEKVFESANQPKHFVRLQGDHNYGFIKSQPEYEQSLKSWLKGL